MSEFQIWCIQTFKQHILDLTLGPRKQWEGCPGEITDISLLRGEARTTERLFQTPQVGWAGWGAADSGQVTSRLAETCKVLQAQGNPGWHCGHRDNGHFKSLLTPIKPQDSTAPKLLSLALFSTLEIGENDTQTVVNAKFVCFTKLSSIF